MYVPTSLKMREAIKLNFYWYGILLCTQYVVPTRYRYILDHDYPQQRHHMYPFPIKLFRTTKNIKLLGTSTCRARVRHYFLEHRRNIPLSQVLIQQTLPISQENCVSKKLIDRRSWNKRKRTGQAQQPMTSGSYQAAIWSPKINP